MAEENGKEPAPVARKRALASLTISLCDDLTFDIQGSTPTPAIGLALAHVLLEYMQKRWEDETRAAIIAPSPGSFAWDPNRYKR